MRQIPINKNIQLQLNLKINERGNYYAGKPLINCGEKPTLKGKKENGTNAIHRQNTNGKQ